MANERVRPRAPPVVFLTLFAVPTVYALLASKTRSPQHVSRLVDRLMGAGPAKPLSRTCAATERLLRHFRPKPPPAVDGNDRWHATGMFICRHFRLAGGKLMYRLILLGAAALPVGVQAEGVLETTPNPQSYQIIDIDFWGTITDVETGPRQIGESITGSMRIDLRHAPSDPTSEFPLAEYIWVPECPRNCPPERDAPSGFVTTRGAPLEAAGNSYDRVRIFDALSGGSVDPVDFFSVRDWEVGSLTDPAELRVSLSAESSVVDFIHGRTLLQEFDLQPAEAGGDTAAGGIWSQFGGSVTALFEFAIDRLRVTPKVCKAPM